MIHSVYYFSIRIYAHGIKKLGYFAFDLHKTGYLLSSYSHTHTHTHASIYTCSYKYTKCVFVRLPMYFKIVLISLLHSRTSGELNIPKTPYEITPSVLRRFEDTDVEPEQPKGKVGIITGLAV